MSMDLNFWRYKKGSVHDHGKVYEAACCDGELVEELENLPIEEILKKIANTFLDWEKLDERTYEKEDQGAFTIFTTSQIVRFDCYGVNETNLNKMIDIMLEYGCPLYDPQINERFDKGIEY